MVRVLLVISFCLYGLILTWVSEDLSTAPRCLMLNRIGKLQMQLEKITLEIPSCSSGTHYKNLAYASRVWPIIRRLNKLKPLESLLPVTKQVPLVRILQGSDDFWVAGDAVLIGDKWLNHGSSLEKSLIMSWLESIQPEISQDHFRWEILAEGFYNYLMGGSPGLPDWFHGLSSFEDYCVSESRSPQHEKFCQSSNLESEDFKLPTVWNFRSLYADGISLFLAKENPQDLKKSIEGLMNKSPEQWVNLPEDYSSLQSIHEWYLDMQLALTGVRPSMRISEREDIDVILRIQDDSLDEILPLLMDVRLQSLPLSIGLVVDKELVTVPELNRTGFWEKGVRSHMEVEIGCRSPKVSDIAHRDAERFLFLDVCKSTSRFRDLENLLSLGELDFLKKWTSLSHVLVDMANLRKDRAAAKGEQSLIDFARNSKLNWNQESRSYVSTSDLPIFLSVRGIN